ncbi:MAG: hypothetical protein ABJ013_16495 [Halioglobus sp.]
MTAIDNTITKYLAGYAEESIPSPPPDRQWDVCVVIPVYAEPAAFLHRLRSLQRSASSILVITVINRPDSDPDTAVNQPLRSALNEMQLKANLGRGCEIRSMATGLDLLVIDSEVRSGPSPRKQGVGLARKLGCDIALGWHAAGSIASPWLYSSDADAQWPDDYFLKIPNASVARGAVTFPFIHAAAETLQTDRNNEASCLLYELRLHHYVLGLAYAGSPYAFHTLGSCLAVHALDYAAVRGFPRRPAGEDFYLLNKVAKLGGVHTLDGQAIRLSARVSNRVPFGTGPAVAALLTELEATNALVSVSSAPSKHSALLALSNFYHPACFEALKALLAECRELANETAATANPTRLAATLPANLADPTIAALVEMGFEDAIAHCHRQSADSTAYLQHLYQWLDGFRTLKFVHAIRAAGFADVSLNTLKNLQPNLLSLRPDQPVDVEQTLGHIRRQLGWQSTRHIGATHQA